MTKKTISTLIISLVFGGGVQAQSFADAVKDGLSPLTNLVNSAKQSLSADTVSKKRADKKNIQSLTLKDGTAYVGEMKGKRPNGQGKAIYKNGDVYEGGFVKGVRDGHGEYRFKDGERYVGEFKDGHQHGEGVYTFSDGRKYTGKW